MFSVGKATGDIAGIAVDTLLAIYSGGATAGMSMVASGGNALVLVSEGAALGSLVEAGAIVDALKMALLSETILVILLIPSREMMALSIPHQIKCNNRSIREELQKVLIVLTTETLLLDHSPIYILGMTISH